MSCENEELPLPSPTTAQAINVVFEASTQTPTNEDCESPLFTPKGYCLRTAEHSSSALSNIQKMKQQGQVCRRLVCSSSGGFDLRGRLPDQFRQFYNSYVVNV